MQRYLTGSIKQLLSCMCIAFIISLGASSMHLGMVVYAVKEYTVSGQTSQKLYEDASESSKVVANIVPGNSFTILETVKDDQGRNWHHVSFPGGTTGYIIASRVIEVEEETVEPQAEPPAENADEAAQAEEQQDQGNDEVAQEKNEGEANPLEDGENENSEENDEADDNAEGEGMANISVTTLSNTNLRDDPSLDGNILVVIPRGVTIRPLEKIARENFYWYRLTYLTETGYIRADAVEEIETLDEEATEEPTEETTEEIAESGTSTSTVTPPKVIRSSETTTVSYEDSYDRRHKWDDPEITTTGENKAHKRFIDIYIIIFITLAILLGVIAFFLFGSAFNGLKRHFHFVRKRRKQRGEGKWTK